jgi:hypothetical protein
MSSRASGYAARPGIVLGYNRTVPAFAGTTRKVEYDPRHRNFAIR